MSGAPPEIVYEPTEKQLMHQYCPAVETLYGGAVGGGKTYSLLWMAVDFAFKYPGATILFVRETMPELLSYRNKLRAWLPRFPR